MGLFNNITQQTYDGQEAGSTSQGIVGAPIFWRPATNDEIVHKYPFDDIRNGAVVIVHQTQRAYLYLNGAMAATIPPTGEPYKLTTGNIPLLGRFLNMTTGGNTAHTAEIWFVNVETEREALWGVGDLPVFDYALQAEFIIGAYGGYNLKVKDAELFVQKLVGTMHTFTTDDVVRYFGKKLASIIKQSCAACMEDKQLSISSIQRNRIDLEQTIEDDINKALESYGVEVRNFAVENFNLPEEYRTVLSEQTRGLAERKRLEKLGIDYSRERQFDIMQQAAANEGTGSVMGAGLGAGMGLGMGVGMGNIMQQTMQQTMSPTCPPILPPQPAEPPIYFAINGQQSGPFQMTQIPALISSGQVTRETLFWHQGQSGWQPVSTSPMLMRLFETTPPPIL